MKKLFGKYNQEDTYLYTLENENISFSVSNYGATLVSLVDKKSGIDVVLGYDTCEEYVNNGGYLGASVGRVANRIQDGKFELNGTVYTLAQNDRGNHLHGGLVGFDKKIWNTKEEDNAITFTYTSQDGEEGYPGTLQVTIVYTLLEDGISIKASGTSDKDTLFAYTNHAYYNVNGEGEINDNVLEIYADTYGPCDENALSLEERLPVDGTPFDFRNPKEIGPCFESDHPQITQSGGVFDHHFAVNGNGMREMVRCKGKTLTLMMESDFPGFHMYTANFKEPLKGKNNVYYKGRASICFEAEYYPNGINYPSVLEKPIVKANKTLANEIRYHLINNE